jgi:DNA-binding NtrC family response regulator
MKTFAAPGHASPFRHLTGTVLLVDDDVDLVESMARGLRHANYRVLVAHGGPEALETLAAEAVDVLVTDLEMPGMDGLELLDRSRDLRPDAVRIVLTGHASAQSAMEAINHDEVHRYLAKPLSRDQLDATLAVAFERLQAERDLKRLASQRPRPTVEISQAERDALREAAAPSRCLDVGPTVEAEAEVEDGRPDWLSRLARRR